MPARERDVCLVISSRAGSQQVPLFDRPTVVIGRDASCDVVVDDRSISRRHAAIHDGEEIEDLGSTNGVTVGGRRLANGERMRLELGKVFWVGSVSLALARLPKAEATALLGDLPEPARDVVLRDPVMERLWGMLEVIGPSPLSVLIMGDTGTGKELYAAETHRRSQRARAPFLCLNCATLTGTLLESELFGHERGAFTGATGAKPGLFESADGGTVFLDEVAELALDTQAKLLRVVEAGEVLRLGSTRARKVDVRYVSATHKNLATLVAQGAFRRDLYYRLNGFSVELPPLEKRPAEILPLAELFLREAAARSHKPVSPLGASAVERLQKHPWPGNVRELRNVVERAFALARGGTVEAEHLLLEALEAPPSQSPTSQSPTSQSPTSGELRSSVNTYERDLIVEALRKTNGSQKEAAKLLGISRRALIYRIELYGLPRPRKKPPS
jgi:two-component system response regulator AtoC